ncbi:hypothetical protein NC651_025028 [Populus alba x Populus x berolinensis]|nr:hypothetical protein NC651_025028 [Populus alba x Populus x berolinensis]
MVGSFLHLLVILLVVSQLIFLNATSTSSNNHKARCREGELI